MSVYTPTPIVEVAFGFGPYDEPDDDDWTDITADAFEIAVQRGRSSEFEQFPASTASVSLYNDDRRYDPLNLSGPHVGPLPTGDVPYIVTKATKSGTSLGSNNAQNMPSGIQAGDLLIAIVSQNPVTSTITASSGWTDIRQGISAPNSARAAAFAKLAAGSDTLSLSGDSQDFACVVLRIARHGVSSVSTDIATGLIPAGGSTALVPANVTIPEADRPYLGLFSAGTTDDAEASPWAPPGAAEVTLIESAQSSSSTMLMVFSRTVIADTDGESYSDAGNFTVGGTMTAVAITLAVPGPEADGSLLRPNTPIRILADLGDDGPVPVWRGVVDAWPGTYSEGGARNVVELACTDVFKVLAERPVPDVVRAQLRASSNRLPHVWYRFDEAPVDGRVLDSLDVGRPFFTAQPIETNEPLCPTSSGSLKFQGRSLISPIFDNFGLTMPIQRGAAPGSSVWSDDPLGGTNWTASFVVQFDGSGDFSTPGGGGIGGAGNNFGIFGPGRIGVQWGGFEVTDTGELHLRVLTPGGTIDVGPSASISATGHRVNLFDGRPHHIVGKRGGANATLYVDGRVYGSASNGAATGGYDFTNGHFWIASWAVEPDTKLTWPGLAIDELMTWPGRLFSDSQVADLYDVLFVGFSEPRLTGTVINDLLDLISWPDSLRAIDDGEVVVRPPANPTGTATLDLLQQIALTEQGRLFVDAEGRVTFHDRSRHLRESVESTVQYVFTDDGSGVGTLDGSLQVVLDDRFTFDAAKVTRTGGAPQSASRAGRPVRTRELSDLMFTEDSQALNLAELIVFRYGTPLPRTDRWSVDGENAPDDWADILGLEIGHRIRHDVAPATGGDPIVLDQALEQIEHDITPERWLIAMNGVPTDDSAYFLWDTSQSTDLVVGWDAGVWG